MFEIVEKLSENKARGQNKTTYTKKLIYNANQLFIFKIIYDFNELQNREDYSYLEKKITFHFYKIHKIKLSKNNIIFGFFACLFGYHRLIRFVPLLATAHW